MDESLTLNIIDFSTNNIVAKILKITILIQYILHIMMLCLNIVASNKILFTNNETIKVQI